MRLTPLDIKRQQFRYALRGYDSDDVHAFLEQCATEVETLAREVRDGQAMVVALEAKLVHYQQLEATLQQTLVQAQQTAEKTAENAARDAELRLREAEMKGEEIIRASRVESERISAKSTSDVARLEDDITRLRSEKETAVARMKSFLSSVAQILKTMESEDKFSMRSSDDEFLSPQRSVFGLPIEDILKSLE